MLLIYVQVLTALLWCPQIVYTQAPTPPSFLLRCSGQHECDALTDVLCRPIGGCERYCDRNQVCTPAPGDCYCQFGYARNASSVCVPRTDCPRACGERECQNRFLSCRCEQHCRPRRGCVVAPTGCHCARGYARDARNVCIPRSLCPQLFG